jgi:hypothetical protein
MSTSDQVNPAKEGWPAAFATCLLAVALWFTAYAIHKNTFHDPRNALDIKAAAATPSQR